MIYFFLCKAASLHIMWLLMTLLYTEGAAVMNSFGRYPLICWFGHVFLFLVVLLVWNLHTENYVSHFITASQSSWLNVKCELIQTSHILDYNRGATIQFDWYIHHTKAYLLSWFILFSDFKWKQIKQTSRNKTMVTIPFAEESWMLWVAFDCLRWWSSFILHDLHW